MWMNKGGCTTCQLTEDKQKKLCKKCRFYQKDYESEHSKTVRLFAFHLAKFFKDAEVAFRRFNHFLVLPSIRILGGIPDFAIKLSRDVTLLGEVEKIKFGYVCVIYFLYTGNYNANGKNIDERFEWNKSNKFVFPSFLIRGGNGQLNFSALSEEDLGANIIGCTNMITKENFFNPGKTYRDANQDFKKFVEYFNEFLLHEFLHCMGIFSEKFVERLVCLMKAEF